MSDLISRQDVIDSIVAWTVEDRPDIEMPTDLVDRVNSLPSADASLMQDRCKIDASSDLINRQDAIDAINNHFGLNIEEEYGSAVQEVINGLPSAERKRGRWEMKRDPYDFFDVLPVCSECGCVSTIRRGYNYCPYCGAEMRKREKQ